MKIKLFYSVVISMIILLSATLYLSSCQKEATVLADQISVSQVTDVNVADRTDPPAPPVCPNCTGTIQFGANTYLGETYPLEIIVQTRPCSISSWTVVKKYKIANFLDFSEAFQVTQDNYYRCIVTNLGSTPLTNFTSVITNPYPVPVAPTNKMIANFGTIPGNISVVANYYKNTGDPNPPLGRGNCGCLMPWSCE